jgi:hypothetical protein
MVTVSRRDLWTKVPCPSASETPEGVKDGGEMADRMTPADRCDRCGSEAYFMAMKDDLHPLLFCVHHGRNFQDRLVQGGWEILDESERIEAKESRVSSNA